MKTSLATLTVIGLSALGAGCQSRQAISVSKIPATESIGTESIVSREAIRLGAGDALGREVFEQAVMVARVEHGSMWTASASDRAILPAFTAHDAKPAPLAEEDAMWAMLVEPASAGHGAGGFPLLLAR